MHSCAVSALDFLDEVDERYAIDDMDDIEAEASVEAETVTAPEFVLTVSDAVLRELAQRVKPLADSDDYGIDLYQEAVDIHIILLPKCVTPLLVTQFFHDCVVRILHVYDLPCWYFMIVLFCA